MATMMMANGGAQIGQADIEFHDAAKIEDIGEKMADNYELQQSEKQNEADVTQDVNMFKSFVSTLATEEDNVIDSLVEPVENAANLEA